MFELDDDDAAGLAGVGTMLGLIIAALIVLGLVTGEAAFFAVAGTVFFLVAVFSAGFAVTRFVKRARRRTKPRN